MKVPPSSGSSVQFWSPVQVPEGKNWNKRGIFYPVVLLCLCEEKRTPPQFLHKSTLCAKPVLGLKGLDSPLKRLFTGLGTGDHPSLPSRVSILVPLVLTAPSVFTNWLALETLKDVLFLASWPLLGLSGDQSWCSSLSLLLICPHHNLLPGTRGEGGCCRLCHQHPSLPVWLR